MQVEIDSSTVVLESFPTRELPLGSVCPSGWYRDVLRCQADNFTGCLDVHWASVSPYSAWLGGTGENWERGPYYLDGLLPLAYLLDDKALIAKAKLRVDWALDSQQDDGNFGPRGNPDLWPRMVMLKALMQYEEASGDGRVFPFMERFASYLEAEIGVRPLSAWGKARGGEFILWLFWLFRRVDDKRLLGLADSIYAQTLDWDGFFNDLPYTRPTAFYFPWKAVASHFPISEILGSPQFLYTHIVNIVMGLKTPTLYSARTGSAVQRDAFRKGVESLSKHHGVVTRLFTGDEHLSGNSPSQGSELCSVVEYMFSLESVLDYYHDTWAADTLELLAFNALPAMITPDFRGHQYLQQANQVLVTKDERNWFNNNDESNLFGLEPNFGCCTANLHQGWPKLSKALWRATDDGGLAACVYAPNTLETTLPAGMRLRVETVTDYPFDEKISVKIEPESPSSFPLKLRIPAWCTEASVRTPDGLLTGLVPGSWTVLDRRWSGGDLVELRLPMKIRFTAWHGNSMGLELGPLIMALKIREQWRREGGYPVFPDWSIRPLSPWNYALAIDAADPGKGFEVERRPLAEVFSFKQDEAPLSVKATARRVGTWKLENNSAGELPSSPVDPRDFEADEESVELIPYAFARLRIAQFPWYQA